MNGEKEEEGERSKNLKRYIRCEKGKNVFSFIGRYSQYTERERERERDKKAVNKKCCKGRAREDGNKVMLFLYLNIVEP